MLQTNKIFIDSRHKTIDSVSNTNFKIEIKENLLMPSNTVAMITDVIIPNSIQTIETFNENLYVSIAGQDLIIKLSARNYTISTLATEIANKMNQAINRDIFTGLTDDRTGQLAISIIGDDLFYIFDDAALKRDNFNWNGPYYDKTNLKSCNDIISNVISGPYNKNNPFVSGFVNCQNVHHVYICSSNLGYNNYGPRGERNFLKKVSMSAPFGDIVYDKELEPDDWTDVSRQLLHTLQFQICDPYGNIIDLHGQHVSFSIILKSMDVNFS